MGWEPEEIPITGSLFIVGAEKKTGRFCGLYEVVFSVCSG
jgi:hypothetical protein